MAIDPTDATHPRLGGEMFLQQPGTAFDATALSGISVTTDSGLDGSNATVLAGLLTADGTSVASVSYDQNDGGTVTANNTATGTYIADPSGNGRMAFTGLGARFAAAYLTGAQSGNIDWFGFRGQLRLAGSANVYCAVLEHVHTRRIHVERRNHFGSGGAEYHRTTELAEGQRINDGNPG